MKYLFSKFKDVGLGVLPILLVVLVLHFSFAHFETNLLLKFIGSIAIIVVGEVLFLSGIDGSVMRMGSYVGDSVNRFSKMTVVLLFAFIFGLVATIAEPDVNVLAGQVIENGINVNKFLFIFMIGAGVGIFVAFALFRIIKSINYKYVILSTFALIFLICIFIPDSIVAIAFDAGGSTTGIVTSPFLLALASGIARNKNAKSNSDNFGVIGIASLGPILAVAFLGLITSGKGSVNPMASESLNIFLDVLLNTMLGMLPLLLIFFIFDICFLKLPKKKKISLTVSSIITFVGLYLFLFGIDFGIMEMGTAVGKFLTTRSKAFSIIFAVIVGFLITFTEPAVKVLGSQVDDVTQGNIKKGSVIFAIAIAMMLAVSIFVVKIIFNLSIWWIVGIGYGLVLLIMPFSSTSFVSIAFDSGGVASGPMCAAFILPMMIGFASGFGGGVQGFGLIASVGLMPILVLEILGVIYKIKLKAHETKEYKKALRISYGIDMFSNIEKLEEEYNRRQIEQIKHDEKSKEFEKIFEGQFDAMKEDGSGKIQG